MRVSAEPITDREIRLVVGTAKLARMIRTYGHLAAHLDPLGAPAPGNPALTLAAHGLTEADLARLPASIVWPGGDTHGHTQRAGGDQCAARALRWNAGLRVRPRPG